MFETYGQAARLVVYEASRATKTLGGNETTPRYLLLGILRWHPEVLGGAKSEPSTTDELKLLLETTLRSRWKFFKWLWPDPAPLSENLKDVFRYAQEEADRLGHVWKEPGHLVLGILRSDDPARDLLLERGVSAESIRQWMSQGKTAP